MPRPPKVSVIVPNYNHEAFLAQRIDSILNQTYQDFELILIDDCSTDNSRDVLSLYKEHPKVTHLIFNETNSGSPFKQWNKGIQLARGEYIWIAESDDWAEKELLETLVNDLEQTNSTISYCDSIVHKEGQIEDHTYRWANALHSTRWNSNFSNTGIDEIRNYLVYRNCIVNASAVLFKKENFSLIPSGYFLEFKHCADWVIWAEIIKEGNIVYNAHKLNHYYRHSNSVIYKRKNPTEARQKIREYLRAISILRRIATKGTIRKKETSQYKWIIEEWENLKATKQIRTLDYINPPFPVQLFITFYISFLKRKVDNLKGLLLNG